MPYAKVSMAAVPKRERKSESLFEGTAEWKKLRADIDRGIKDREALQITLAEADYARIGIQSRRTVARFIQKYLEKEGHEYKVKSFQSNGLDFIVVTAG